MAVKRQQNISDEERERRRKRMLELREKLAKQQRSAESAGDMIAKRKQELIAGRKEKAKEKHIPTDSEESEDEQQEEIVKPKPVKKTPAKKIKHITPPAPMEDETDSESESEDEVAAPVKPKRKAPTRKAPVMKKVSIKYYGKVDKEQVEADARMFEGLHRTDVEKKIKKKAEKAERSNADEDALMDKFFG